MWGKGKGRKKHMFPGKVALKMNTSKMSRQEDNPCVTK